MSLIRFVEQFHDPDDEPESDDFHEDNIENMTTAQLKGINLSFIRLPY